MGDQFYGKGLFEYKTLDRFKYRGIGRPRKQDYSLPIKIQKKLNKEFDEFIENRAKVVSL